MADDSPGKVQALRAMFAEKNNPVMGLMPLGGKLNNRPWKSLSTESSENIAPFKERILKEQKVPQPLINKVLPFTANKNSNIKNSDLHIISSEEDLNKISLKPVIGPKPPHFSPQSRTNSSINVNSESTELTKTAEFRNFSDSQNIFNSQAKSKAVAETIASFMFTNGVGDTENDTFQNVPNNEDTHRPIPKPRSCQSRTNFQDQKNVINSQQNSDKLPTKSSSGTLRDLINADNYICKSSYNFRRKNLPSLESLGPAPDKPPKPPHMVLPSKYCSSESNSSPESVRSTQPPQHPPPSLPPKFLPPVPQRPGYPCPPRPHTPPPLPPCHAPIIKPSLSLREEIEELYEDTLLGEQKRPVSLIPEYTAEEEAEELYNDADVEDFPSISVPSAPFTKPKESPSYPSEYLQPNSIDSSGEELYQDAEDGNEEEFYEEMPCDTILPEEPGSPVYSNNKKEIEKLQRDEEKKLRKEQKEREKRDREMEKLRRKFGLTGEEIPIDDGLVKADSRGGRGDLPVKKGETVLILRMEGNPSGRWLVKNERGKIGYVELANIEVDPLSVKSGKGRLEDDVCTTPIEKNINWLSKITACVR